MYLAVYDAHSGVCETSNVGVVEADNAEEARRKAQTLFSTTASIYVTPMESLHHGWVYYR